MPDNRLATFGKRAPDGAWEIPIIGDIGFFGTNGEDLIRELQAVRPDVVKFVIFSPGGAVYDAIAVAGWVLDKGIECYAEIYGVCASAATVFAALAGPKNTAIAPGSMFLVHMPYGGDQKAIDNAVSFLTDLYVKAYGWTKAEAKKHMEAEDGQGVLWNTTEAKKLGVVGEIMEGAKVAARYQLNNEQPQTMQVKGKLVDLVAVKGQAATFEIDPTAELKEAADALATAIADRIAAETKEKEATDKVAALEVSVKESEEKAKAAEDAKVAEVTEVTAKLDTATKSVSDKDTVIANLTADVAKLKKLPTAKALDLSTDGQAVDPAGEGKDNLTQGEAIVKTAMAKANPLQLEQAKMEAEKAAKK